MDFSGNLPIEVSVQSDTKTAIVVDLTMSEDKNRSGSLSASSSAIAAAVGSAALSAAATGIEASVEASLSLHLLSLPPQQQGYQQKQQQPHAQGIFSSSSSSQPWNVNPPPSIPKYIPVDLYPEIRERQRKRSLKGENYGSRKRKGVGNAYSTASSSSSSTSCKRARNNNKKSNPIVPVIPHSIIKCIACDLNNDAEYVHPLLHIPTCGRCHKMYNDAAFSVDIETSNHWECVMCGIGDGNWMFMCDMCPHSFCQRCMLHTVGAVEAERVRALQEWNCYLCQPKLEFDRWKLPQSTGNGNDKVMHAGVEGNEGGGFTFFNIESVFNAIRPPVDKRSSSSSSSSSSSGLRGSTTGTSHWSMTIADTYIPPQLAESLSHCEKKIACFFCSQIIPSGGFLPLLRMSDNYLTARDMAQLPCLSSNLRGFFSYVIFTPGLFRTAFGSENHCGLYAHQNVSLRWMYQAENNSTAFNALRGGIIGDAPGLGKTVTVLALILSTAGRVPVEPSAFWDVNQLEQTWIEGGKSSEGNYRRVEVAIRDTVKKSQLSYFPPQLTAEAFHKRFLRGDFPTMQSFECGVRDMIRSISIGNPNQGEIIRQSFRRNMLSAKASMDKRSRSSFNSLMGARMVLERSLMPSTATLIVVPMALLEHWFEQISRHLGLDYVAHTHAQSTGTGTGTGTGEYQFQFQHGGNYCRHNDQDSLAGRRGVVYFDGLGDILDVQAPLPRLKLGGVKKNAIELSQYLIVVTTFERCAALFLEEKKNRAHKSEVSSKYQTNTSTLELQQIRWLRLIVDEGHELGASAKGTDISPSVSFIRDLAAERRWVMSGTPTTGTTSSAALVQIQKLLTFLRHPLWGTTVENPKAGEHWQNIIAQPFLKQDENARKLLEGTLRKILIRHSKHDLKLFPPIRHTVVLDSSAVATRGGSGTGERDGDRIETAINIDLPSEIDNTSTQGSGSGGVNDAKGEGDDDDDNEIDKLKAKHIYTTIKAAQKQWETNSKLSAARRLSSSFAAFAGNERQVQGQVHTPLTKCSRRNNSNSADTDADTDTSSSSSSSNKAAATPTVHHNHSPFLMTQLQLLRRPKIIVFSTDKHHLAGVGHFLYLWMGDRSICEHGGMSDHTVDATARKYMSEMRSAELSRFRTSKRKYRACPLCGGENYITGGPTCSRILLLVEYDPLPELVPVSVATTARLASAVLAPVPLPVPARGGHGASGRGSFFQGECLCSPLGCKATTAAQAQALAQTQNQEMAGKNQNTDKNNDKDKSKVSCRGMPNPFYKDIKKTTDTGGVYIDPEIQGHSQREGGRNLALVSEEHIRHWVPGRRWLPNEEVYILPSSAYSDYSVRDIDTAVPQAPLLWSGGRLGGNARVRAWKRCGKASGQRGWHSGSHILKSVPWIVEDEDASVLLLQEDGSTGMCV